jgi:hypothetical protein
MKKKDAILFFLMIALTMLSVSALFYRSVVLEDFEIMANKETPEE